MASPERGKRDGVANGRTPALRNGKRPVETCLLEPVEGVHLQTPLDLGPVKLRPSKQQEDKFLLFKSLQFLLLVIAAAWNVYLIEFGELLWISHNLVVSNLFHPCVFLLWKEHLPVSGENPKPLVLSLTTLFWTCLLQPLPVVCTIVFTSEMW